MGIFILWLGYIALKKYFFAIDNYFEVIEFSNREGFFTAGLFIPIIHTVGIIGYYYPEAIKKHTTIFNLCGVIALMLFLFSGFYISSLMRSNIENKGYIYCHKASGISALEKNIVYTKNMDICEEIVVSKRKERR